MGSFPPVQMQPSGSCSPQGGEPLAVASRLEQPSVVDMHYRQCLRLPRQCHRGAISYVGEQCVRPDRTFAR